MLNTKIENALNEQLKIEAFSSQYYLAIASWAENNGLNGTAEFFYQQSDEERMHMLRVLKFINERGGTAIISAIKQPDVTFKSLTEASPEAVSPITEYPFLSASLVSSLITGQPFHSVLLRS